MVVTRMVTVEYLRTSPSVKLSSPGQRMSASEFPATPSTCHGTPSGCVSGGLGAPRASLEDSSARFDEPYVVCAPIVSPKIWQSAEPNITESEISFEVRHVENLQDVLPEWDEESEIDEVIVISPRRIRRSRVLSVIVERPKESNVVSALDFEVIRSLQPCGGNGSGELVLGRKIDTAHLYAVKVFRKAFLGLTSQECLRTEQAALRLLTESMVPFTPRLHWSFQDEKAYYLVLSVCAAESLQTCVERRGMLLKDDTKIYAAEILEGLEALHAENIVHRDLKPESVLIGHDGHVVLSDFEHAKLPDNNSSISTAQLPVIGHAFQAPELLLGWAHGPAVDWWSFGLILCYMLTGAHALVDKHNWTAQHYPIMRSQILHGELLPKVSELLDVVEHELISKCLERNPALRLSGEDVRLRAFFADIDWTLLREKAIPAPFKPDYIGKEVNGKPRFDAKAQDKKINEMLACAASRNAPSATGVIDGFSFTWERQDTDSISDQDFSASYGLALGATPASGSVDKGTNSSPGLENGMSGDIVEEQDPGLFPGDGIPAEFGGCQLNLSSAQKFGTLRKYSSLNFATDTDTLESAPVSRSGRQNPIGASPTSMKLPRSLQSTYLSPFTGTHNSNGARNKLRKKTRPDSTPVPAYTQYPVLNLPPGIEQIGNGIGYTRRVTPVHPRFSMSTLTPRTCHAIFTGGRFPGMTPRLGRKKASGSGDRFEQASSGVSVMDSVDESEDHMDAVMREMYGSRWNLGTSASELAHAGGADPRAYMGMTRTSVGLGLGEDALETSRADRRAPVPPAEHSTLTPESTLRLVPPSLHGPGSYC